MSYKNPDIGIVTSVLKTVQDLHDMLRYAGNIDTVSLNNKKHVKFSDKYEYVRRLRWDDVALGQVRERWAVTILSQVLKKIEDTYDQGFLDVLARSAQIRADEHDRTGIGDPGIHELPLDGLDVQGLIQRFQWHLGLVRTQFDHSGELHVLLSYDKQAQAEHIWSDWTKVCRGLVMDLKKMQPVVYPYDKFYNLNETEYTKMDALPNGPYEDAVKEDGSLGNFYIDTDGTPRLITRGSLYGGSGFNNGAFGTKILFERYSHAVPFMVARYEGYTFMFEIIYNKRHMEKIVVEYDDDDVRLIGVRDLTTNRCATYSQVAAVAREMGVPSVRIETMTLEKMFNERKLRSNFEGWVRAYDNGLRVKIKCEEYLAAHWATFYRSHRKIWWYMVEGSWDDLYSQLSDAQRELIDKTQQDIVGAIQAYDNRIYDVYRSLPNFGPYDPSDGETKRRFSTYVAEHVERQYASYMYNIRNGSFTSCINTISSWRKFRDLALTPYIGADNIVEDEEA